MQASLPSSALLLSDQLALTTSVGASTLVPKAIELPGRVRLEYVERGDASGVPVVLLHGLTDSWRCFEPILSELPPTLRALAVSQRGHGDSERPVDGYAVEDFSEDVAALLDALDIREAIIVGHSMGSFVAQRFAMDHPDRTLGLVLIGSVTTFGDNPVIHEFWNDGVSKLADPIAPAFALEFQESTLAQPVPPTYLETVVRESLKVPARVWKESLASLMKSDHSRQLGKIQAPTLIVWGERDAFCPSSHQEALSTGIAGAPLSIYAGAGHAAHWEEPARFAAELAAFVRDFIRRS